MRKPSKIESRDTRGKRRKNKIYREHRSHAHPKKRKNIQTSVHDTIRTCNIQRVKPDGKRGGKKYLGRNDRQITSVTQAKDDQ